MTANPEFDLHTLLQAMDAVAVRPEGFALDEVSTLMTLASRLLARFMAEKSLVVEEVLAIELEEAEPEGRA